MARLARPRQMRRLGRPGALGRFTRLARQLRSRTRLLALAGFLMGTIGSCGMPNIKPPSL